MVFVLNPEVRAKIFIYCGMSFLAGFSSIHYYLYLRLRDVGYRKSIFNFLLAEVPVDYLRLSTKHGWSRWPAYVIWPILIGGLVLFSVGVLNL